MYYRKISGTRKKRKIALRLVCVGLILLFLFLIAEIGIRPILHNNAVTQTKIIATNTLNQAITKVLSELPSEETDYIRLEKKEDGTVSSIQINHNAVSKVQTTLTQAVMKSLSELKQNQFEISLGTLLSPTYFAQKGPQFQFVLNPIGYVTTQICNDFAEAGINQTRHSLFFRVSVQMFYAMSGYRTKTMIEMEIPLANTVILGEVPEYYTNVITKDENLVNDLNDYAPSQPD